MPALPTIVLDACKRCNVKPADLFQYRIGADDVTLLDLVGHKYRVHVDRLNGPAARLPGDGQLVTLPGNKRSTRPPRRK